MGRTRPKTRKAKALVTEHTAEPATAPPISALLEKAQELIVSCDYELAARFARRVLEREPQHVEAKEMLGVAQLETGELEAAKKVRSNDFAGNGEDWLILFGSARTDVPVPHTPISWCAADTSTIGASVPCAAE